MLTGSLWGGNGRGREQLRGIATIQKRDDSDNENGGPTPGRAKRTDRLVEGCIK